MTIRTIHGTKVMHEGERRTLVHSTLCRVILQIQLEVLNQHNNEDKQDQNYRDEGGLKDKVISKSFDKNCCSFF